MGFEDFRQAAESPEREFDNTANEGMGILSALNEKVTGTKKVRVLMHVIALAYLLNKMDMLPVNLGQEAQQPTAWVGKKEHPGGGIEIVSGYTRPTSEVVRRFIEAQSESDTAHVGESLETNA